VAAGGIPGTLRAVSAWLFIDELNRRGAAGQGVLGAVTVASTVTVPAGLFSPGERVEHHQWGPGLLLEAEADRLTVLFDEYGYRELATQVVSGRHLLAPARQAREAQSLQHHDQHRNG
jgi:hypothetical protein